MNSLEQGTLIYINFDPSRGSEIKKRRPAIVISRDEYALSSRLIIVCPITSSSKDRPYFVDIQHEKLKVDSKVNTKQLYTLDYNTHGGRNVEVLGKVSKKEMIKIAQHVLMNFNFGL